MEIFLEIGKLQVLSPEESSVAREEGAGARMGVHGEMQGLTLPWCLCGISPQGGWISSPHLPLSRALGPSGTSSEHLYSLPLHIRNCLGTISQY